MKTLIFSIIVGFVLADSKIDLQDLSVTATGSIEMFVNILRETPGDNEALMQNLAAQVNDFFTVLERDGFDKIEDTINEDAKEAINRVLSTFTYITNLPIDASSHDIKNKLENNFMILLSELEDMTIILESYFDEIDPNSINAIEYILYQLSDAANQFSTTLQ